MVRAYVQIYALTTWYYLSDAEKKENFPNILCYVCTSI